jgi:hypothetical protein
VTQFKNRAKPQGLRATCGPAFRYVLQPPDTGTFTWDGKERGTAIYKDSAGTQVACVLTCRGGKGGYLYFEEQRNDALGKIWVFGTKATNGLYPVGFYYEPDIDGTWSGWMAATREP